MKKKDSAEIVECCEALEAQKLSERIEQVSDISSFWLGFAQGISLLGDELFKKMFILVKDING
jgi:hypothetical protein